MTDTFQITSKDWQEIIKDLSVEEIEWKLEGLKGVADEGYLYWGLGTPADALASIMKETLPSEFMMLQDPDYYEKALAGIYPPPQPDAWIVLDEKGQPVARPHDLPGFSLIVFASEEEATYYGQMIGLITPEMMQPQMQPVMDPMTGQPQMDPMGQPMMQPMPPELPVVTMIPGTPSSRWARLLNLTTYKGKGPFHWEQARFIKLWSQWGRKLESAS